MTSLDTMSRRNLHCGIIVIGYFNKFRDLFLRKHYGYEQLTYRREGRDSLEA